LGAWALAMVLAPSALAAPAPQPEPDTAVELLPRPCAYEGGDPVEKATYKREGWSGPEYVRYPGACERLRFAQGPIAIKPGQNDVLAEPIAIQKPLRDGYVTRMRPNLVRADGSVPPLEDLHLHHMGIVSEPNYGTDSPYPGIGLPFFAAGEEKTIALFPRGYGLAIKGTDQWAMLYMVHSAISRTVEVYITYDIDFVPQEKAEAIGLRRVHPLWLDVRPQDIAYPVFNVQRAFGGADGRCTWPREKCASFDPWGRDFIGQGEPGNGKGADVQLPARGERLGPIESFTGGTLVGMGGHLHPGGVQNEVDLVRPGRSELVRRKRGRDRGRLVRRPRERVRIYTGRATYWDRRDTRKPGGPPTSWDFSMTFNTLPQWGVRVEPGDVLRVNATYDTRYLSTYENMGTVVAWIAPDDANDRPTAPGVDPFKAVLDRSTGCRSRGLRARRRSLCDTGPPTHGHLKESDNRGGPEGKWGDVRSGSPTDRVDIVDFLYAPGDFSTISMTGLPTVKLGTSLQFTNEDAHSIFHTVTSCDFPCTGPTGTSYPLSAGRTSSGRSLDFDSSELGFGSPFGPARQAAAWSLGVSPEQDFRPGEVVTYFCRVHPSMRGAFEVTE
jgi:plastocyanin